MCPRRPSATACPPARRSWPSWTAPAPTRAACRRAISSPPSTARRCPAALQEAVKEYKAGDKVTFSVYRDGDTTTVDVTLDEENQEREEAMNQLQQDYYEEQQAQQQQQQQQGGYFQWPFGW